MTGLAWLSLLGFGATALATGGAIEAHDWLAIPAGLFSLFFLFEHVDDVRKSRQP